MTEKQWLTAKKPEPMFEYLQEVEASERKLRLFICGCCRQKWSAFTDARSRAAVEVAERYADGRADFEEFNAANETAHEVLVESNAPAVWTACCAVCDDFDLALTGVEIVSSAEQCRVLRDIFGNPFRPVAADPRWLTSTVRGLATAVYEDRAFDRLPILADALEDAGCDNADILAHCRGDGPHVRGCWVVDLILGKS